MDEELREKIARKIQGRFSNAVDTLAWVIAEEIAMEHNKPDEGKDGFDEIEVKPAADDGELIGGDFSLKGEIEKIWRLRETTQFLSFEVAVKQTLNAIRAFEINFTCKPKGLKYWQNIYRKKTGIRSGGAFYNTKAEAESRRGKHEPDYIGAYPVYIPPALAKPRTPCERIAKRLRELAPSLKLNRDGMTLQEAADILEKDAK
jgi:hypothetical protein